MAKRAAKVKHRATASRKQFSIKVKKVHDWRPVFAAGIFLFVIGLYLGSHLNIQKSAAVTVDRDVIKYVYADGSASSSSLIKVPAVDNEGNGVVTDLKVDFIPGTGRILANIDRLFFVVDTQNSIRTAKDVAEQITSKDLSKYDIIYTVDVNATVIEGGSAGAALTIATIAAIQNKTINQSVIMTGTINSDGSIGPVGEVLAKAAASKERGATLFLTPLAQSVWRTYKTERSCDNIGPTEYCTTETKPVKVNIEDQVGIDVKEVPDIKEAMKYFFEIGSG